MKRLILALIVSAAFAGCKKSNNPAKTSQFVMSKYKLYLISDTTFFDGGVFSYVDEWENADTTFNQVGTPNYLIVPNGIHNYDGVALMQDTLVLNTSSTGSRRSVNGASPFTYSFSDRSITYADDETHTKYPFYKLNDTHLKIFMHNQFNVNGSSSSTSYYYKKL